MAFEPIFEKINFNRKKGNVSDQIKAECRTGVLSDNVSEVLSVSAWATVTSHDNVGGQIRYGGRVIFYLSYVDSEGVISKCECGNEFSGSITGDIIEDGCGVDVSVCVDKTDYDVGGKYLTVNAIVSATAEVIECAEVSALTGGDDLIVDAKEVTYSKSFGIKEGAYPVEEEFELDYPILEVLNHRAEAVVTAVQCGVGAIIVDGEVLLNVIVLQKSEKRDIIKENRLIPFRMEIEYEEAMPVMQATAKVSEKSFKTDITVDEETGKSIMNVSVILSFKGEAYATGSVVLAADAFSTQDEVELKREDFPYYRVCEPRSLHVNNCGKSVTEELPVGVVLSAVGSERLEVLRTERSEDGKILVEGLLTAVAYLRDGNGKVFTRRLELPISATLDGDSLEGLCYTIGGRVKNSSARIVSLTEIEIESEIVFTIYPCEESKVGFVSEIKCTGEKKQCDSAISVYIAYEGEELWSLSKRLNTCPEALVQTNRDLTFPLTGKERIVVYRRK